MSLFTRTTLRLISRTPRLQQIKNTTQCLSSTRVSQQRPFCAARNLRVQEKMTINSQRLWDTLHYSAQWGATPEGGVRRLALSQEDKAVREWFAETAEQYGAVVKTDEVGNQFAIRPGSNNDLPPIGIGSHLDTQPAGGRYDGILGVQAGLEIFKILHEHQYETFAPLAVISKSARP